MKHQLIVTILGADKPGILAELANLVCDLNCNILDSRQAHYGLDFSFTMILEGSISCITKAEFEIPRLCQKLDLLSMSKRTQKHSKQHLIHLADVEFQGKDAQGIIKGLTEFLSEHHIHINAFRQKTTESTETDKNVECKMVVSMPQELSLDKITPLFDAFLEQHHLCGSIVEKT